MDRDDRGRFCSFNTLCGRNCTPVERDRCRWWEHAKEEPKQVPLVFVRPVSHAKDDQLFVILCPAHGMPCIRNPHCGPDNCWDQT